MLLIAVVYQALIWIMLIVDLVKISNTVQHIFKHYLIK